MNVEIWGHQVTVEEPKLVGDCYVCGGEAYDYEITKCQGCDSEIHIGCKKKCAQCGHKGCKSCLKENMEFVDVWTCNDDCEKDFNEEHKEIL